MDNVFEINEGIMEKINCFTRKPLTADEVYCFSVILCDNDVDRDFEKFSLDSLGRLAELFIGRTGIFDHDPKGENQTARIFDTEIKTYGDKTTKDLKPYTALIGYAYMLRTDKNKDLIAEIDGGIKKEVSVSCSVSRSVCSICGADRKTTPCSHVKGQTYGEKLCFDILEEPTDAYEWSFVAVPAQINAGVTKKYSDFEKDRSYEKTLDALCKSKAQLDRACEYLRGEILKLSCFTKPYRSAEFISRLTMGLDMNGLFDFKKTLENEIKRTEKTLALEQESFITAVYEEDNDENNDFKM